MWIAKPIQSLSLEDLRLWEALEAEVPLAQTLVWAQAIEASYSPTFLIFSPDEKVGGILFQTVTSAGIHYECINGPYLRWDDAGSAPRQLATFVLAASKLKGGFSKLTLRPRWEAGQTPFRLESLPISPQQIDHAATLLVPILESSEAQLQALRPRLRRTLNRNQGLPIEVSWKSPDHSSLEQFVNGLSAFGHKKKFVVPPLQWFEGLVLKATKSSGSSITFEIGTACLTNEGQEVSESQMLLCYKGKVAHYLFGYDSSSTRKPSAVSTSAVLHWEALNRGREKGIQVYDLNGFMTDIGPEHSYFGVAKFKEQFAGDLIQYDVPEFVITV